MILKIIYDHDVIKLRKGSCSATYLILYLTNELKSNFIRNKMALG